MTINYQFNNSKSPFFRALKDKVDLYFKESGQDRSGNATLHLKGILQALSALGMYIVLVFFTPGIFISIILSALLGLNLAIIGFNIMHEGGHQSFSRRLWMNKLSAYSLNMLGGNTYFWKIKHNINHHTYTNIEGMDSDIDVKPFMRLHANQPLRPYHRFQHIYWIFLYGISYLAWIFYEDFQKYFSGKISATSTKKQLPLKEHFIFWASKILYLTVYVVIPVFMLGWLPWLVGFLIVTSVCGLVISVVFQLAHVVETTKFHLPEGEKSQQEWAVHQVISTSNFATSNKVLFWLLGGLNFQVEHHLFPRVSHIHYPAINRLVKETCKEYNVAYHEFKSMTKAIVSHLTHLRHMGRIYPA